MADTAIYQRRIFHFLFFWILLLALIIGVNVDWRQNIYLPTAPVLPQGLQNVLLAYPEHLIGYDDHDLIWCDSSRMPYDQRTVFANFDDILNRADLRAQMAQVYPTAMDSLGPPPFSDPGRIRYEPFFQQMYGHNQAEVEAYLEPVQWLPTTTEHTVLMSSVNQVHKQLQAVSLALDSLPDSLKQYVLPPIGGSYSWRPIAGTERMSMHSFGICIDIAVRHSDYWRWREPSDSLQLTYHNRIPHEIVRIFERHGFIWGGKWYHYDTMHFEYRPELL